MTDEAATEEGYTPAEYNRVTQLAKLAAISLMKSSFEVKTEMFDTKVAKKLSYDVDVVQAVFMPEEEAGSGVFRYAVEAKAGRKNILKCVAEYFVVYEIPSEVNAEAAQAYVDHVGLYAAYAYFRSWFSQAVWASNVKGVPPLPTLSSAGRVPRGRKRQSDRTV